MRKRTPYYTIGKMAPGTARKWGTAKVVKLPARAVLVTVYDGHKGCRGVMKTWATTGGRHWQYVSARRNPDVPPAIAPAPKPAAPPAPPAPKVAAPAAPAAKNPMRQRRDPFGRVTYVPKKVMATGYGTTPTCSWCGRAPYKGQPLYAIEVQPDAGRTHQTKGLFCSWSCVEAYHGGYVGRNPKRQAARRNAPDGWVVTHDGETLKTFPDETSAVRWLHKRQGQSVDWAVRYSGYDIVKIEGGKVVYSYRRAQAKGKSSRNPQYRFKRVSAPPHLTGLVCLGCRRRMNTTREPVYADLQGKPFKAYYCEPCTKRRAARSNPARRNPINILLTKEVLKRLPPLYSQENVSDPIVQVKFFTPWSNWTWYGIEYNPAEHMFFGLVSGHEKELGNFSLDELAAVRGPGGIKIERDLYFRPTPLSKIQSGAVSNRRRRAACNPACKNPGHRHKLRPLSSWEQRRLRKRVAKWKVKKMRRAGSNTARFHPRTKAAKKLLRRFKTFGELRAYFERGFARRTKKVRRRRKHAGLSGLMNKGDAKRALRFS